MAHDEAYPVSFAPQAARPQIERMNDKPRYMAGSIPNIENFPTSTASLRQPWRDFISEPAHRKWINTSGTFRMIAELDYEK
ncbi:hypothetical protein N7501_001010 [Penicillium viridicatum]|nr:hypothetical protein N7501_001010 [Penicillium viridicatum]